MRFIPKFSSPSYLFLFSNTNKNHPIFFFKQKKKKSLTHPPLLPNTTHNCSLLPWGSRWIYNFARMDAPVAPLHHPGELYEAFPQCRANLHQGSSHKRFSVSLEVFVAEQLLDKPFFSPSTNSYDTGTKTKPSSWCTTSTPVANSEDHFMDFHSPSSGLQTIRALQKAARVHPLSFVYNKPS